MKTKTTIFSLVLITLVLSMILGSVIVSAQSAQSNDIEKIKFIHYKDKTIKIEGSGKALQATCYKLFGVKWITPVTYTIDPTNQDGLSDIFVTETIKTSAETWDTSTSKEIFNDIYLLGINLPYGANDGINSIMFGSFTDTNVIAETSLWYSRRTKQILDTDMKFNEYYTWGDATINPSLMDLQNIATHELGHVVGLGDIYNSACSTVTMYGYSSNGEINKRTLERSDILGLQKIYGV